MVVSGANVSTADAPPEVKTDFSAVENQSSDILMYYEAPDSIEGFNRVIHSFNTYLMGYVIRPFSRFYSCLIPDYGRRRIALLADNLDMPGRLINCMLQGRWRRSGIELSRFGINTTIGVAGLWDVADSQFDMLPQVNGFGMTFEHWGIGSGCYLVIPIEASSTVRDGVGLIFDLATDPLTYLPFSSPLIVLLKLNDVTNVLDEYTVIQESSVDSYETFKGLYFVKRIVSMQDLNTNGIRGESIDTSRNGDVK
ncbi:MAG: hypothetical protein A2X47_06160 [Lentisphaerae bacterium GWF2_38_69]|nr:MAG: hypothetical protein A2X47_06160 [Lentisphaerae bacterium GWF2_38_69]